MDIPEGDHKLINNSAWIEVKGFAIRIASTDEGVVVDIYESGSELNDALASTYVFDAEI